MSGGKKNKYSLDIGEAQVKPSYAVDVGEANIRPPSGHGIDVGEAEIKPAMSPQDDLDAELDSILAEDSDSSLDAGLDAEIDSVLSKDETPLKPDLLPSMGKVAAQGATWGWGDELSPAIADALGKIFGEADLSADGQPPTFAAGSQREDLQNQMRRETSEAREAYPVTSFATEAVAGALPVLASQGRLANPIAAGAITGAGYADGDLTDRAVGAGAGAALGQAASKAAPYLAQKGSQALEALGAGARKVADMSRLRATGANGADIRRLGRTKGQQGLRRVAEGIEREGIHQAEGKLAGKLPAGWGTYAKNAERVADDAGQQIANLGEEATARGVKVDMTKIANQMVEQAAELEKLAVPEAKAEAAQLLERASMLAEGDGSFSSAHATRRYLDNLAWDADKLSNSALAKNARKISASLRQAMGDALEATDPALRDAFRQANQSYESASWALQQANERLAMEGGRMASPFSMFTGVASMGASPFAAIPTAVTMEAGRRYGAATTAGAARGLQHGAARGSDALASFAQLAKSPQAAGLAGRIGGISAPDMVEAMTPDPQPEAASPGSPEGALAALQQNPDAFGSYGAIIEQAAREGDMETFRLALLAASKEQSK